jgi:hypothetical protein
MRHEDHGMRERRTHGKKARRAAFSLLEVLLATTVLIVIVMMVALIFRQANNAWNAGTRKADTETVLRGIVGFIDRDLTHAIDSASFPGITPNNFTSPDYMRFLTLDGTNRVPLIVEYTFTTSNTLERSSCQITASSGTWSPLTWSLPCPINGENPLSACVFSVTNAPVGSVSTNLPLCVTVEVHMRSNKQSGLVSGWCEGRNRPGHPEDRIEVMQ